VFHFIYTIFITKYCITNSLYIKFRSRSGGFQKLINLDNQGVPYATKYYSGLQAEQEVSLRFIYRSNERISCVRSVASTFVVVAIYIVFVFDVKDLNVLL